ncbi:MAG: hypothetical protein O9353_04010, partial [Bacteroidia bacterium]|nr:hypothetical protein [Bacteroidia bacterium]
MDAKQNLDNNGFYVPFAQASSASALSVSTASVSRTWQMIGPNYAQRTKCNTQTELSGGFCDRVYVNPNNTNRLYAGFSYGGLWVSHDQGANWTLTDGEFDNGTNTYANRDYYYGEIEASSLDQQLVFAATEAGLLKSTNGGMDWSMCPQLNRTAGTSRPYYVATSRSSQSLVLATYGRKVYRSADGGTTWTVVFDNSAGGPNHRFTNQFTSNATYGINERNYNFFGLEQDQNDLSIFYLGVYNAANNSCIYKSTDGGQTFTLLVNLDVSLGRTMPSSMLMQTISATPDNIYVFGQFTADTLYKYHQNGNLVSRQKLSTSVEAGCIDWSNGQVMYTGFYGASSIMKSTDGAATFTDQTSGYSGCPKYVHPDVRSISAVGNVVFIGHDGGLSLSLDGMSTVNNVGREISAIDLWGFSSSPKGDILSAGCDHGPTKIRRFNGDNGWIARGGGDANETSVNQSNDRIIYYDHGYGRFKTKLNANNQTFDYVTSIPGSFTINRMAYNPLLYQTVYAVSGSSVMVTRDNFTSLQTLTSFSANVSRFIVSPADSLVMYALIGSTAVKKSINGGASWTDITPSSVVTNSVNNFVDIATGDQSSELWLGIGNSQTTAKILKSTNGGSSWTNITTSNLPSNPVIEICYQRGTNGGIYLAFAGRGGVWYRNNTMPQWAPLGTGLPMIGYVRNASTVPQKGKFRMGSSRGAWEHDLYEPTSQVIASLAVDNNKPKCPYEYVNFVNNSVYAPGNVTVKWIFQGGLPATS